jgi:ABC-type transport system substrate-binding protein
MPIPDDQLELFATRLEAIGLGRRHFLQVAGAMAALGGLGFATRAEAAKPVKLGPGEKLAKDQTIRMGGGGQWQQDPASHDFNKNLYCTGVPSLFAGLMSFTADFVAEPYLASKVQGNKDGSVWTFTMRKDSRWSDNSPVRAQDFEWSWKRQLDPESKAPYAAFLYDIKGAEAFNKGQLTDRDQVGVKAKDDWTLEVTLEGPRGYFPGSPPTSRRSPRIVGRWRSTPTSGRRRGTSSATAPSSSSSGSTTGRWCSGRTPTSSTPRT